MTTLGTQSLLLGLSFDDFSKNQNDKKKNFANYKTIYVNVIPRKVCSTSLTEAFV